MRGMGQAMDAAWTCMWRAVAIAVVLGACSTETPGSASAPSVTSAPSGSAAVASPAAAASPTASPTPAESRVPPSAVVAKGESWIVYQWLDGSGDGIFLIRPDGTGLHQLAADLAGSERHPDWSPDGQRIAFVRTTPADDDELWVVDADGSDSMRLAACELPCNQFSYPDWNEKDAIHFGFDSDASSGPPSTFGVGRFDLNAGTWAPVIERKDGMTAEQPRLSHDGSLVAYTRGDILESTPGSSIYVADLASGAEKRVTDPLQYAAHPDWTADGRIVFNTYDLGLFQDSNEPSNLYVIAADGSALTTLSDHGPRDRITQPRVSPDGSAITFTRVTGPGSGTRQLGIIDVDGTNERYATDPPVNGTHPQLRPLP